jgi:gliding motility-associated-like protein
MIKKICLLLAATSVCASLQAAIQVSFAGVSHEVISVAPDKNTGLETVYVVYDSSAVSEMSIAGFSSSATVSKYSNLGGGYAQPVPSSYIDGNIVVTRPEGDMGYIVEENGRNTCFWLTDYLPHRLSLNSVSASAQQECESTTLEVAGSGDAIHYYSIDGRQCELSRDIKVEYKNLEWSEESESYLQHDMTKEISHITSTVSLTPPLYCNSVVYVSGDKFLETWGMGMEIESQLIMANGLAVQTKAEQTNAEDDDDPDADASNMISTDTQGLGGSAPADFTFTAYTTDAVIHNEWQIAADQNFEYIDYRFNEQNLDYTFTEEGTYYVRFVGSNSDGTCETYGETYTIGIGSSDLRIPNAFTPNDDGVNDVWKVGYRSLLSFRCTIFDRYGNEIFKFSDPTQGWDGKYKGKYVKPGVYFYVIEAKGADGKTYKKGGDINIIKSKRYTNTATE